MGPYLTIIIIALSVALDAFAVSIAGGMQAKMASMRDALKVGIYFGVFQAGMPLIGWGLGLSVREFVAAVSGVVAFTLLGIIGLKMIKEALSTDHKPRNLLTTKTLFMMAVATSIDALVVGVSLSLVDLPFMLSISVIGIVTFCLSFLGFLFGKSLGSFHPAKISALGGLALIAIGFKELLR